MKTRPIDAVQVLSNINWHHKPTPVSEFESGFNQGLNQAMWIITHAPTLTPPNEWVSVEEGLPEESDGMVLFTNGRAVTSGYRNHMFRMSDEEGVYAPAIRKGGGYMRVTHWMHLPAPPDRRPPEGEENTK